MKIFLIGASHHQSPVEIREKLASIKPEDVNLDYCGDDSLREFIFFSTCNRVEVLAVAGRPSVARQAIVHFLAGAAQMPPEQLEPHLYSYQGQEAVRHIFRVAASLDSLVLGEAQILGQIKSAFRLALKRRNAGPVISKLMHKSFRAAKRVRSETRLAGGAVSVSSAAARLAVKIMGPLNGRRVLILGAGHMAALAAAHFEKHGGRVEIMSRNPERARETAEAHNARPRPWEELPLALTEADALVAATAAAHPILTAAVAGPSLTARAGRPLLMVDIGVPRNVSADLAAWPGLTVKNIDDLREVVSGARSSRKSEAARAEAIVAEEAEKFAKWYDGLSAWPTIVALTGKAEDARRAELTRTLAQHQFSPDQKAALEVMTRSMIRRILHDPLTFIKKEGHGAVTDEQLNHRLEFIRRAFNL